MTAKPGPAVLIPDWPGMPANVGALSTLRAGGVSRAPYDDGAGGGGLNLGIHVGDDLAAVAQNRALLRSLLPAEPAWLSQVHGTVVLDAARVVGVPEADASIAMGPGAICAIMTADCLPVLFCDVRGRVVGAAHAGWRGLVAGVLENTVAAMRAAGAGEILVWLGPAIGPACFEVGEEVRQAFLAVSGEADAAFLPNINASGKYFADICHLARLVLHRQGIDNISGGGFCTVTDAARFYSYRRDRTSGRMASLIWLES
ncbi:peptidoglycan editing factor PgeF [Noviherbaspirillum sedimenti]|uniref:Purine nucleoside phosphorylase n=1 Tax=Noviherbaspirillum sedimenti TaxID=2320865 RepID=A0A3A3G349_9BURK|nr:peptidoglycan editing factor PgeF [Noviherbaspirillum sedimenti]RJG01239.1 peptidoglycan editing factor PgeF [Noviherbaspirillum sedimenti]